MEASSAAGVAGGSPSPGSSPNQSPKNSAATIHKVPSHSALHTVQEGQPDPPAQDLPPPVVLKGLGRRSQEPPPLPAAMGRGLARQSISFNCTSSQLNLPSRFRVSCRPGVSSALATGGAAQFDPLSQQLSKACYSQKVRGAGPA
jgi:hypothetical protein